MLYFIKIFKYLQYKKGFFHSERWKKVCTNEKQLLPTSSRSTKSARPPPLAHILSTTLSILLFTLHFVFPRVSRAYFKTITALVQTTKSQTVRSSQAANKWAKNELSITPKHKYRSGTEKTNTGVSPQKQVLIDSLEPS